MSIAFRGVLAAVIVAGAATLARADAKQEIKESGAAFANALNKGDAKEAEKYILPNPDADKFIEAIAPLSAAHKKLVDEAVAKYGEEGKTIMGGRAPQGPQYTAKDFDDAQIDVEGDTAMVTSKKGGKPVKFKRQDGTWKMDFAEFVPPAEQRERTAALLPKMAAAMNDTAGEIKDGKYPTLQEARLGLRRHIAEAMGFRGQLPGGAPGGQR